MKLMDCFNCIWSKRKSKKASVGWVETGSQLQFRCVLVSKDELFSLFVDQDD